MMFGINRLKCGKLLQRHGDTITYYILKKRRAHRREVTGYTPDWAGRQEQAVSADMGESRQRAQV